MKITKKTKAYIDVVSYVEEQPVHLQLVRPPIGMSVFRSEVTTWYDDKGMPIRSERIPRS